MNLSQAAARPRGVTALACLFAFGMLASGVAVVSLLTPGGPLEPIWRLNPHGNEGFVRMGVWAPILLSVVCLACAAAAYGFFTGQRWGYWLGITLLVINLAGDILNSTLGIERRAWIGVPIAALLIWYLLSSRVRSFFSAAASDEAKRAEIMDKILGEIRKLGESGVGRDVKARQAAELIRVARSYHWVGIYEVTPTEINAIGWTGAEAPSFPTFARTQGLNGAAVASCAPVVVQDVTRDARYLTTFGATRAEAIFPVVAPEGGQVVGTIDVESERTDAFTAKDVAFLEGCALALVGLWA